MSLSCEWRVRRNRYHSARLIYADYISNTVEGGLSYTAPNDLETETCRPRTKQISFLKPVRNGLFEWNYLKQHVCPNICRSPCALVIQKRNINDWNSSTIIEHHQTQSSPAIATTPGCCATNQVARVSLDSLSSVVDTDYVQIGPIQLFLVIKWSMQKIAYRQSATIRRNTQ